MIRIYQLTFILTEYMLHEFSHAPDAQYTNETLACHGFIGATVYDCYLEIICAVDA